MNFRLYRLPYVALAVVFHCMMPQEVLRLSLISKKSHRITKSLKKKPERLEMYLCGHASIELKLKDEYYFTMFTAHTDDPPVNAAPLRFQNKEVRLKIDEDDKTHIFFENDTDRFDGLTLLCDYLTDFFSMPISFLLLNGENSLDDPKKALEWVLNRQDTLERCFFQCFKSGDEEAKWFLDRVQNRVTQFFYFGLSKISDTFRYTFQQPLTAEVIEVGRASWLSINNLFDLNSRFFCALETNLTSENMNLFVKHWLNGGNSNLGYLSLRLKSVRAEIIFDGIEFAERDHAKEIEYVHIEEPPCKFRSSYQIKRSDGIYASILMNVEENLDFAIVVWPDWDGNLYPVEEMEIHPESIPESIQNPSRIIPGSIQNPSRIIPGSIQNHLRNPSKIIPESSQDPFRIISGIHRKSSQNHPRIHSESSPESIENHPRIIPGSIQNHLRNPSRIIPGSIENHFQNPSRIHPESSQDPFRIHPESSQDPFRIISGIHPESIPESIQNPSRIIPGSIQNHLRNPSKIIPESSQDPFRIISGIHPESIPESIQNPSRIIRESSPESIQNHPRIIREFIQNHPKIIPESIQDPFRIHPESSENPSRITTGSIQNHPRIHRKSFENPSRIIRESSQNPSRIIRKSI
ncbi:unnamed protein product [Caenorhabditis brenneri]